MGIKASAGHWLERWPVLYRIAARIYYALKPVHLLELLVGTKARENEWAARHLQRGADWKCAQHIGDDDEWVMSYWDSRNHSHRSFLVEKIAAYYPISSILEIGCNCGPNLYLLAQKFPDLEMVGIDINPRAVQKGNELLSAEGISNTKLICARADELHQFKDNSFDIVFTDAVLMYIGPDKIQRVIGEVYRVAKRALILLEWHCFGTQCQHRDPRGMGIYYRGNWKRDYTALLRQFVSEGSIYVSGVSDQVWAQENWNEVGAIVEVVKKTEK